MSKLLLLNPNYLVRSKKKLHLEVQRYPPLSLAYLASNLKEEHDVKIIDAASENLSIKKTIEKIDSFNPNYIGIYVTSFTLPQIKTLISKIKKDRTIILGGPHITHFPKSFVNLGADYAIIGEGEISLNELIGALEEKKDVNSIKGLVYKKDNTVHVNKERFDKNLDKLKFPARHLLDNSLYFSPLHNGKITTMITSKGCIYDCIFCALPDRKTYRERSAENVVEEIKEIISQGFDYIEIQDDLFTLNKNRIKKICQLMIDNHLKISWGCETRADMVDEELLSIMRRAGCLNIKFGVEAASDRVRNEIIEKKLEKKKIIDSFRSAKKVGMQTIGYFMFGNPTETITEVNETIDFAIRVDPDYAEFHMPIPIPGSRLFDKAIHEGFITKEMWNNVSSGAPIKVYHSNNISLKDLESLRKKAYLRFYFRPKKIFNELKKIKSLKDFSKKISIVRSLIQL